MRTAKAQGGMPGMRMMVVFEKGEPLRYIGHLDLMRAMQRALRRSGLPIRYSNGFNPHIRLSFAAPLSVGIVGLRELMEVPLEEGVREDVFKAEMNAVLPSCLRIRQCRTLEDDFPALMSLVAGSRYLIRFPSTAASDRAADGFDAFMALASYTACRRTKSGENACDIRPFVTGGALKKTDEGWEITLETVTTAAGSLKPSLWLECLRTFTGAEEFAHIIYRTAILARAESGELVAMEEV